MLACSGLHTRDVRNGGEAATKSARSASAVLTAAVGGSHGGSQYGPANLGWPARPPGATGRAAPDGFQKQSEPVASGCIAPPVQGRSRNLGCRLQDRPVCCRETASGGNFIWLRRPPREGTRRPASLGSAYLGWPIHRPASGCRRESARGGFSKVVPECSGGMRCRRPLGTASGGINGEHAWECNRQWPASSNALPVRHVTCGRSSYVPTASRR